LDRHIRHQLIGKDSSMFDRPPSTRTADGLPRRVGVEVEFMGPGVREAARALAAGLGGIMIEEDPHAVTVRGTRLGDLTVELDLRHAHPQRHGRTLPIRLGQRSAALLGFVLGGVVPRELITAPLPLDRLDEVDGAIAMLRHGGATGRGAVRPGSSQLGSLGLHFNVDVPELTIETILAHLRAFMLLDPWLRTTSFATRNERVTAPPDFPEGYTRLVLSPDYRPDLADFSDDYLAANPTRDRALDLLPLLLHLDGPRVRRRLPREKISARAVFHYRLPQAHVGDAGWSIAPDWNRWTVVERLAADHERLSELSLAWLLFKGEAGAGAWIARPSAPPQSIVLDSTTA
jgi:hypothetical protein